MSTLSTLTTRSKNALPRIQTKIQWNDGDSTFYDFYQPGVCYYAFILPRVSTCQRCQHLQQGPKTLFHQFRPRFNGMIGYSTFYDFYQPGVCYYAFILPKVSTCQRCQHLQQGPKTLFHQFRPRFHGMIGYSTFYDFYQPGVCYYAFILPKVSTCQRCQHLQQGPKTLFHQFRPRFNGMMGIPHFMISINLAYVIMHSSCLGCRSVNAVNTYHKVQKHCPTNSDQEPMG